MATEKVYLTIIRSMMSIVTEVTGKCEFCHTRPVCKMIEQLESFNNKLGKDYRPNITDCVWFQEKT